MTPLHVYRDEQATEIRNRNYRFGRDINTILHEINKDGLATSNHLPMEVYIYGGKAHVHLPGIVIAYDYFEYMDFYRENSERKECP